MCEIAHISDAALLMIHQEMVFSVRIQQNLIPLCGVHCDTYVVVKCKLLELI